MNFKNGLSELILRTMTSFVAGGLFLAAYFYYPTFFYLLLGATLGLMLVAELPQLLSVRSWRYWVVAPIYPTIPVICLFYLHHTYYETNRLIPLYPFLVAWTADSAAYFVGKAWGRHKICPRISPGKSWEGLLGGFVGVVVLNGLLFSFSSAALLWSFVLVVLGLVGDLFESFLKRRVGLKDVGALLPGHGGMLDRCDSVLFVAPAVALGVLAKIFLI